MMTLQQPSNVGDPADVARLITAIGGNSKETTVLGIPSMTLRNSIERSETVTLGTNELIGTGPAALKPAPDERFAGQKKKGKAPNLCDGGTGERIAAILLRQLA